MKKLLIIIGTVFSIMACQDDFLERYPKDKVSSQNFFKSTNDLKLFANLFYPTLPSHTGGGAGTFGIDANSDNLIGAVLTKD